MSEHVDQGIDGLLPFVESMKIHADLSRRTAYDLLNSKKIHAVKIGTRTLIRKSELARFLASLPSYEQVAA